MNKLLLCDLDGTVRTTKSGATFINEPHDQKLIPEAASALAHYHQKGWRVVGITNQGGVASGFKSLEDAILEQQYTLELCPQLVGIAFCPDFDGKECYYVTAQRVVCVHKTWHKYKHLTGTYRKPKPGMLQLVMEHEGWSTKLTEVLYTGDRAEDDGAAAAAGVRFLWAADWYMVKN